MLAHIHWHLSERVMLPWFQRLISLMNRHVTRFLRRHMITIRAVTMTRAEGILRAVSGRPVAVVVKVDVAEVAV